MISFISDALLNKGPCCKFLLKQNIKNYLRQFIKTLSIAFQRDAIHTHLVTSNYFWFEQLNASATYQTLSNK